MSEVRLAVLLHVDDGDEQMARDIRRMLASRKALKRLLNAITVIKVDGPGMKPRGRCYKSVVCIHPAGHTGDCLYVGTKPDGMLDIPQIVLDP